MRWTFEVPGQPISWNAAYKIGRVSRPGGRGSFSTMVMTEAAKKYEKDVVRIAGNARPSGWHPEPETLIIVEYRLHLGRHLDADNTMKLTNDAIAAALGVDDKWFLPRAMSSEWGLRPAQRRLEITIEG